MFKYEYVKIENEAFSKSTIGFLDTKYTKHRDVIDEYAKKGYRFVGFIPIKTDRNGKITEMDLVFEIQAQ